MKRIYLTAAVVIAIAVLIIGGRAIGSFLSTMQTPPGPSPAQQQTAAFDAAVKACTTAVARTATDRQETSDIVIPDALAQERACGTARRTVSAMTLPASLSVAQADMVLLLSGFTTLARDEQPVLRAAANGQNPTLIFLLVTNPTLAADEQAVTRDNSRAMADMGTPVTH